MPDIRGEKWWLSRNVTQTALSVFAVDNADRFVFTYREFANVSEREQHARRTNNEQMLRAIDFTDHPTDAGLLRPRGLFFAGHAESLLDQGRHFRLRGQTVYELTNK